MIKYPALTGLTAALLLVLATSAHAQPQPTVAIVIADSAAIRASADGEMVQVVVKGRTYPVVRVDDAWVQVVFDGKTQGVVAARDVEVVAPGKFPEQLHRTWPQLPTSSPALSQIRDKCAKDWPNDFAMRNFCEEQQLEALEKLRQRQ